VVFLIRESVKVKIFKYKRHYRRAQVLDGGWKRKKSEVTWEQRLRTGVQYKLYHHLLGWGLGGLGCFIILSALRAY
jgi:hypothetical protein